MESPFIIPLAVFAMVILIVAIVFVAKVRDVEIDVRQKLYVEEMEHQRRMKELDLEIARLRESR